MTLKMNNIDYPSYKRWERVRAYEFFGCGKIVVPESQGDLYRKRYGDAVVTIPDHLDGSIPRKRNALLDLIKEEQEDGYGFIIDDDINRFKRKKENINLTGDEALEVMEKLYIMAKDIGATYGGFDYSQDCMKLKDMSPFSLTKPVYQLVLVNAQDNIRYDERFRINEDVEIWVQKMNSNRRMIRDNQYVAVAYGEDGASNSVIGYDKKEQQHYATMINKKWGLPIMRWNKTRFKFTMPIKGV